MFWHTDSRKGMIRAQIYIKGGGKDSGAFQYMQNTHSIDHQVDHKLNNKEILELKDNIYNCYGESGDLLLFDTYGFHAKNKCIDERINLGLDVDKSIFQNKLEWKVENDGFIIFKV